MLKQFAHMAIQTSQIAFVDHRSQVVTRLTL